MPIAQLFPSVFSLKLTYEQTSVVNILKLERYEKGKVKPLKKKDS